MMAGTGFFDSWQPVDTNNPSAATPAVPVEEKAIVTEDWPKGDKSEGFDSMEDHPMVTQFNEATGQGEANVSPPPAGIVTLSNNPAWAGYRKRSHSSIHARSEELCLHGRIRSSKVRQNRNRIG